MSPERWQRVTALLENVLPCDPSERETLLRGLCADDEALRREVQSLLAFEDVPVAFLEKPLVPWARDGGSGEHDSEIGLRIGPYRVLGRLGAGGMGSVFLAQREDGFLKRVALKRIQRRKLSEEVFFRFENERQILADLEHPNIARILDGGTTEDMLPYFAMEYVEGQPIDSYCDENRLSIRQRLELVLQVCSALQVAHENLVVHRDLKPGNILVTGRGVPKLIDFGIAKHLEPAAAPHEVATELGSGPMTLRYASPEQIRGGPITTASDVYSLGVLVYQLLSGHDPYRCDEGRLALMRSIAEHEPVPPSVAVTRSIEVRTRKQHFEQRTPEAVSWPRCISPDQLRARLAGDLDSIVLKALRKRPQNRYRSVEQLADDVRRHLAGQPVGACEGTFRYLAGKFVRRHLAALATTGALLVSLTISGLAVAYLWRQAAAEEVQTALARIKAERTTELLADLLESFDPDANRIEPFEFLSRAQRQITEDLRTEPELLADFLNDPLAKIYVRLGRGDHAMAARREALTVLRTLHSTDHPKTAEVLLNLGTDLFRSGDLDGAQRRWREALHMRRRLGLGSAELVVPLNNLATSLARQGQLDEAAENYRRVLDIKRQLVGADDPQLVPYLRNLGKLHFVRGEQDRAEALLRRALAIELATEGASRVSVAKSRSTLGRVLQAQGRLDEAAEQLDEALAARRQLYAADHAAIARVEKNLASVLLESGDLPTARVLLDHARSVLLGSSSTDEWEIAELESLLGWYLAESGEHLAAENCLVESYRALEASRGPGVIYTRQALARVIDFYEGRGDSQRAEEYRADLEAGANASTFSTID